MKKKISALLLSLALCAGLLAGCGAGETEEAPSDTDVQQVDSLKIAFSPYADADLISESTEPLEELLKASCWKRGKDSDRKSFRRVRTRRINITSLGSKRSRRSRILRGF